MSLYAVAHPEPGLGGAGTRRISVIGIPPLEPSTAAGWRRWQFGPAPKSRHVLSTDRMAEVVREHRDLTAVMRVVLEEVKQHVDETPRHTRHACATFADRALELLSEHFSRQSQPPLSLAGRERASIERRESCAGSTHAREGAA